MDWTTPAADSFWNTQAGRNIRYLKERTDRLVPLAEGTTSSNLSVTATTHATSQEVVTLPALEFDGRTVIVAKCTIGRVDSPVGASGHVTSIALYEMIAGVPSFYIVMGYVMAPTAGGSQIGAPVHGEYHFTPSAGTRIFSLRSYVSTGTGAIVGSPSGVAPPRFELWEKWQ